MTETMVGVGDTVDIRGELRKIVSIQPCPAGTIVAHVPASSAA